MPLSRLPSDHTDSSTPAHARSATSSLNAGSVTSIIPKHSPSGSVVATIVRRPDERSAPSQPWPRRAPSGRQSREGGDEAKAKVPTVTSDGGQAEREGGGEQRGRRSR